MTATRAVRTPQRSIIHPTGRQKAAPISEATRLMCANVTRSTCKSASSGSVTSPRPCVAPGSVAVMATEATMALIQP